MTCARCGYTSKADWERCRSCAAPAGAAPRVPVDCLATPQPRLAAGETGEQVRLLGAVVVGLCALLAMLALTAAVASLKSSYAISDGDLDASSVASLRSTVRVVSILVVVAIAVVWFALLMRLVSNARAFGLTAQRFSGGWLIANWFIPVVNLWRPKQIVDDVWEGSGGLATSLVDWWWTLAVFSWVVLDPLSAVMLGNRPGNPLRNAFNYTAFSTTVSAAVWVLAAVLVFRVVALQRRVLAAPPHED